VKFHHDIPFFFEGERRWWLIDDAVPASLRERIAARAAAEGFEPATVNTLYRDSDRAMFDDDALAEELWGCVQPHVPARLGDYEAVGLNERFRVLRYRVGQKFVPHTDHWFERDEQELSLLTVLLYLNDGYTGGHTRLLGDDELDVEPRPGRALVFQHKVEHEGTPLEAGEKVVLRTEVMFRRTP
jgi:hypothetical protein